MIARMLWRLSLLAVVGQAAWIYPSMPAKFASHFDGEGNPNAWMGRGQFYVVWFLCIALANMTPPLTGWLIRNTPASMINLPHKDYWLADETRKQKAIGVVTAGICMSIMPVNAVLIMAMHGVWSHARTGQFIFPLPIFLTLLALAVISPLFVIYGGLRVPKDAS